MPLGSLETIATRVESGATQRLTTCLPSSQGAVTSAGPPASLDASKVQILAAPAACPATQRRPSDAYIGLVRPVPNGGTVRPAPPRHRASSARLAETPAMSLPSLDMATLTYASGIFGRPGTVFEPLAAGGGCSRRGAAG